KRGRRSQPIFDCFARGSEARPTEGRRHGLPRDGGTAYRGKEARFTEERRKGDPPLACRGCRKSASVLHFQHIKPIMSAGGGVGPPPCVGAGRSGGSPWEAKPWTGSLPGWQDRVARRTARD